jgi:hypothetical protein
MRVQPQIHQSQEQERQSQRADPQRRVESDNNQNEGWYGGPMRGRNWSFSRIGLKLVWVGGETHSTTGCPG